MTAPWEPKGGRFGSIVAIRPQDGSVSSVDRFSDRSADAKARAWNRGLHDGTFAGLWSEWIWFLIGLTPVLLFVTGFIMWWNRVVLPWLRKLGDSRAASDKPA